MWHFFIIYFKNNYTFVKYFVTLSTFICSSSPITFRKESESDISDQCSLEWNTLAPTFPIIQFNSISSFEHAFPRAFPLLLNSLPPVCHIGFLSSMCDIIRVHFSHLKCPWWCVKKWGEKLDVRLNQINSWAKFWVLQWLLMPKLLWNIKAFNRR